MERKLEDSPSANKANDGQFMFFFLVINSQSEPKQKKKESKEGRKEGKRLRGEGVETQKKHIYITNSYITVYVK